MSESPTAGPEVSNELTIELRGVHKWYGQFHVLKDINLEVEKGERIVICGPSGSGKSTMIRCINRLEEHQRGQIIVDGTELTDDIKNIDQIRREVGMVFQHFNLFPHLTVLENCCLALIWVRKMPRKEAEAIGMQYLERVKIPEQARKYPGQLSGGQQQRVAIARAIAKRPKILLCDEPTGALDLETARNVLGQLQQLTREQRLTTILITHNPAIADIAEVAPHLTVQCTEEAPFTTIGEIDAAHTGIDAVDRIDVLHQSDGDITGISTGYTEFDKLTAGLQEGDLVIIAGRPSMGKTTLAVNIAENAAIGSKVPTAIFSMEMPAQQLAFRMISSLGRVDQSHLRTGRFPDEDWSRINTAVQLMSDSPIFIDDTPGLSPTEIRARARRLQREHGLGLIVVDYLQLMSGDFRAENRVQEISFISRSLKGLAKELELPIIALSQLNRSVEQRTDKRPIMSDLRESGAIEQDADLIVFIYRDEVYNENIPEEDKGKAEIIIGKQRNGPIGAVNMTFLGQYTKFENYAPMGYAGYEDDGY